MNQISSGELGALTGIRVFFGHQSVGEDILNGLHDLLSAPGSPSLSIVSVANPNGPVGLPERGYLLHAKVGINTRPETKCADFARLLEQYRDKVDVAVLKYCFVDVRRSSDPEALVEAYHTELETLQKKFPSVVIIPATVPLMVSSDRPDWKRKQLEVDLRRRIGFFAGNDADNIRRAAFNDRLREIYRGKLLFDIAALESTYPDGKRAGFRKGSLIVPSLIPEYSRDGGHLNEAGRKAVASGFVKILAEASSGTRSAQVR